MKIKTHHLFLLIILSISACTDILESDLGDEKIVLTAPSDSARNDKSSQTFLWEDLREDKEIDLEYYNLQIAEPSFDSINRFVLDTNVSTNSYTYSLEAGEYQWRVRGENTNTKTPFTARTLFVDSLFDITNSTITLLDPSYNKTIPITLSGGENLQFTWNRLTGADSYRIQVVFGSFDGEFTEIGVQNNITRTTASFKIPKDKIINNVRVGAGAYEWKVTAKNEKTNSNTSSVSKFKVDTAQTTTAN